MDHVIAAMKAQKHGHFTNDGTVIQGPWQELNALNSEHSEQMDKIMVQRMLREAMIEPSLTMDDLLSQRCLTMWRVTRKLAEFLGLPAGKSPIALLFSAHHPFQPVNTRPLPPDAEWTVPPALRAVHHTWTKHALPLLASQDTPDEDVEQYLEAYKTVAEHLGIPNGSQDTPQLGRYGLKHIADERFIRAATPTPYHLVATEQLLVEWAMDALAKYGVQEAIRLMRRKWSLSDEECGLLMAEGRKLAVAQNSATEEESRALITMRLDYLFSKAKDLDPRVALGAVKTIAVTQGLTRHSGDGSDLDALADVIDEQNEEQRRLALEAEGFNL